MKLFERRNRMGMLKNFINSLRFKDIIILKEDSELERKVEILKRLKKDYPEIKKISDDLKMSEIGLKGEKEILRCLKNSNVGMYILHDITLSVDDLTAQIDYIVITQAKCYLIECKNLKGSITIDSNGQFIRKYELNGEIVEEAIESPLSQAERHREILLKLREKNRDLLHRIFFDEKLFDDYHKAIVVLTNNSSILINTDAPQKYKDFVIKSDELVNYIKNDLRNTKLIDTDYKKDVERYAKYFKDININKNIDYKKIYLPKCPDCGGYLVKRKKYNVFYGCSNYPKCKHTEKIGK